MGSRQKPRHTVRASAQRETPAPVSLTQPFSERELDKSHSFFCDILLGLFWSRPSVAFLQRSWGNIIQLPPCDPRHTTNPVVHSSVAKEKAPPHNVLLRIRTFKGIRIVRRSPPFGDAPHGRSAAKSWGTVLFLLECHLKTDFNTLYIILKLPGKKKTS